MVHAFRILTYLLAGMGCAFAAAHIMAPPARFIPPALWTLASVFTWAVLWLVYLIAASTEAWRTIQNLFRARKATR
jgi:hypothetical protein